MSSPLSNVPVQELRWSALRRAAHYAEVGRYLRGSQYSASITTSPFYYFASDLRVVELPTTPGTAIENVTGRYTIWHNMRVWQWGIFHGIGANAQFHPLPTEDVTLQ